MKKPLSIGDRVGLTADFVKFGCDSSFEMAGLRGEIIAILSTCNLAVVQWDGVPNEEANHTYAIGNLCRIRSNAFREVTYHHHKDYDRKVHG